MVGKAVFYDSECEWIDCVLQSGYHEYFENELVKKIEQTHMPNIQDIEEYVKWLENLNLNELLQRNLIDQKKGLYEGYVEEFLISDYKDYLSAWKNILENYKKWPNTAICWL